MEKIEQERGRVSLTKTALIVKVLREQEVCSQIFVLLTREVGLDDEVFGKSKGFQLKNIFTNNKNPHSTYKQIWKTHPLDGLLVLRRDLEHARLAEGGVVPRSLAASLTFSTGSACVIWLVNHANEGLLVLADNLEKFGVGLADLL